MIRLMLADAIMFGWSRTSRAKSTSTFTGV
ncbi:hypothetical protein ACVWXL_005211 [Bradyrhizobium sp. GM22.5]